MAEIFHSGCLEKWAPTARGHTWRNYFITLSSQNVHWYINKESCEMNVYIGVIEVPRIVNVKIVNSDNDTDNSGTFNVQMPNEDHKFRAATNEEALVWVQHVKNATLPLSKRTYIKSTQNTHNANLATNNTARKNPFQPAPVENDTGYTREIIGGHMVTRKEEGLESRPSNEQSSSESDLSEVHGDQSLIKQGYLIKQGRRVRNWKRRLFTLSGACLAYRELEGAPAKGKINVSDMILARVSSVYPEKKYLFEVITKKRTYYMEASSEDEMQGWITSLSSVLISTFEQADAQII